MFHNFKSLALIALLAFPLSADAQQHRGRGRPHQQQQHQPQGRSPRADAIAAPRQLGPNLAPAGTRPTVERFEAPRDGWHRWPQAERGWWKQQKFNRYPFGSYYAVPYTGVGYDVAPDYDAEPAPAPPAPATMAANKGMLQFDINPPSGLDYYIDGVHVGSSSTLGSEFEVNAGARQIEIRARGYKSSTFDKRIEEGRITTVRGALEPIEQPQPARATGGHVMYVIPGCYMGNTKPSPNALPPGCDIRKMTTRGL